MPRAIKSASMWYARAQQLQRIAEAIDVPMRLNYAETEFEFQERLDITDLTRRRLLAEANRCWAKGGKRDLERMAEQEQPNNQIQRAP